MPEMHAKGDFFDDQKAVSKTLLAWFSFWTVSILTDFAVVCWGGVCKPPPPALVYFFVLMALVWVVVITLAYRQRRSALTPVDVALIYAILMTTVSLLLALAKRTNSGSLLVAGAAIGVATVLFALRKQFESYAPFLFFVLPGIQVLIFLTVIG